MAAPPEGPAVAPAKPLNAWFEAHPDEFSPALLRVRDAPPHPAGRKVVWALAALLAAFLVWAGLGRLDIVAVADGRLIPAGRLKIVQPSESGIVTDILVKEGDAVRAGQVLMRMDTLITEADASAIEADYQRKRASLLRIDAELAGRPLAGGAGVPPALWQEVGAQYRANLDALQAALAEEGSRLGKARKDLAAAEQIRARLSETLPHYREQDEAFARLKRDGFAGNIMASDKKRERLEKENELRTQEYVIESARAGIEQSERKLAQIESDYRRALHTERNEVRAALEKLAQEKEKQAHRRQLHELKAPQGGVVKDLATHTAGTVVQPGTVLLTLVPKDDALRAEVWVANEDVGFVRKGQSVKLKVAAFPFQKYGLIEGVVEHLSADAAEAGGNGGGPPERRADGSVPPLYKVSVAFADNALTRNGERHALAAGMRATAEIHLGTRTVAEYLLSPLQGAWHDAGRER